jgi:hypothetical protein
VGEACSTLRLVPIDCSWVCGYHVPVRLVVEASGQGAGYGKSAKHGSTTANRAWVMDQHHARVPVDSQSSNTCALERIHTRGSNMKLIAWLSALVAIGCLAAAGFSYWQECQPPTPIPNFIITPTEIDLPDYPIGTHDLVLKIHNPANVSRRIIGLNEG